MEGGPPCFPQTHRGSWYSGSQPGLPCASCTGLSPPAVAPSNAFQWAAPHMLLVLQPQLRPHEHTWFGLFPSRSPLLRESRLISLRRATEMFQFAHCPPPCLCLQQAVSRHHSGRVAPFGFSGLVARMQLPLNVSPVSASFIGLQRLGIHLVLSLACALLARCFCFLSSFSLLTSHASTPLTTLVQAHTHSRFLCFSLFLPWQY